MNARQSIGFGALFAAFAVAAAAAGAHLLRRDVGLAEFRNFQTAAYYQLWHAMAMILVGLMLAHRPTTMGKLASLGFLIGAGLFCGGMYAGIIADLPGVDYVVPVGGTILILAWLVFAAAGFQFMQSQPSGAGQRPSTPREETASGEKSGTE